MYVIAGLGNPGPKYHGTRHNVGWMVIDRLIETHNLIPEMKRAGTRADLDRDSARILLFKPATYVNTSGQAIKSIVSKNGVEPARLIIIHDDLDLDFGGLRIKAAGRSGGHRGINSIIASVGSEEFPRVKVGIGRPPGRMAPSDFVLKSFSGEERDEIEAIVDVAAEAALAIVDLGLEAAMNRYNQRKA